MKWCVCVVYTQKKEIQCVHISWINNNGKMFPSYPWSECVYLHNYIQIEINNAKQLNYMFIICVHVWAESMHSSVGSGERNITLWECEMCVSFFGYAKYINSVGMEWCVSATMDSS